MLALYLAFVPAGMWQTGLIEILKNLVNLVPRVFPLGEGEKTLVDAGHVSAKI